MQLDVSDIRSNSPEQIDHAVKVIGRSRHRLQVFEAIYRGKQRIKTALELEKAIENSQSSKPRVRVLQEGGQLAANQIVNQVKIGSPARTAYEKIPFYSKNYKKIVSLVNNPKRAKSFATKRNQQVRVDSTIRLRVGKQTPEHRQITIDEIDSFAKVRNTNAAPRKSQEWKEDSVKRLLQEIFQEKGEFKDWGGEYSDLFSTRVKINGRRIPAAIALKGRSTTGKLTPEKMGKRGTQIERLFQEPARAFLIVYHGQIDSRVISQMEAFAIGRAMKGEKILYGVIDGFDLDKIIAAYQPQEHTIV